MEQEDHRIVCSLLARSMVHVNQKSPIIGHYNPCFTDEKTEDVR